MKTPKKFRAWDAKLNLFVYFDLRSAFGNLPADIKDEEIQQFTGLTDKNGTDIYIGDIVVLSFAEKIWIGIISWDKYLGFKTNDGGWTSMVGLETHGEIIGNILQNKNLLN